MNKLFLSFYLFFSFIFSSCISQSNQKINLSTIPTTMQITSPAFESNQSIPAKYTCQGDDINPPLNFSNIPPNTQSLVLIVDDPDAPNGNWVHWLVWNIDPQTITLKENSVPAHAIQGLTSFGTNLYGGPCPPSGTHRYFFKLFALDAQLTLPTDTDKSNLTKAIDGHILDQTELIGLYQKK